MKYIILPLLVGVLHAQTPTPRPPDWVSVTKDQFPGREIKFGATFPSGDGHFVAIDHSGAPGDSMWPNQVAGDKPAHYRVGEDLARFLRSYNQDQEDRDRETIDRIKLERIKANLAISVIDLAVESMDANLDFMNADLGLDKPGSKLHTRVLENIERVKANKKVCVEAREIFQRYLNDTPSIK